MSSNTQRINGFDALRSIAMWLGIVLHAIIVYKVYPEPGWPNGRSFHWYFLDWLYEYIHFFRMPLFFLVAGFFSRFVILRSGKRHFVAQRFKKIVVPFVVGVIVLVPISLLPFNYYELYYVFHRTKAEAWAEAVRGLFAWNGLAHLWFLYYLIIFYVATLGGLFLAGILPSRTRTSGKEERAFSELSFLKLIGVILVLFLLLYYNQALLPSVYTGIKPDAFHLIYYGLFFFCGWLLQINRKSLSFLTRYCWFFFVIGTSLSVFLFFKPVLLLPEVAYLLIATETVSLVAGFTGIFLRYCHADSKFWRYFSDSAYWVYLAHFFVVITCQLLLLQSAIPGWLRPLLVLSITFIVTLLTYQYFIRYTIIGEYLHGKRTKR